MDIGLHSQFGPSRKSGLGHLWCWVVALLFIDGANCMWTPTVWYPAETSIGSKDDSLYMMKSSDGGWGYCPISVLSQYPYLVKVNLGLQVPRQLRTGVILSHMAVLTTCRGYDQVRRKPQNILVTAQRIFRRRGMQADYCYQSRGVISLHQHPKCLLDHDIAQSSDKFWDFQILVLEKLFYAEKEFAYPTIQLHKQPYELMQFIRKVNTLHKDIEGCELPHFIRQDVTWPIMARSGKVDIMEHEDLCISTICHYHLWENPGGCRTLLHGTMNNSFVCLQPKFKKEFGPDELAHHGAPLVCNNSGIGMSTTNIMRLHRHHWLLAVTFLRVWPWLMLKKHQFWLPFYDREPWDSPILEHIPWQRWDFNTPPWDKDISSDRLKRFRFVTPYGHQGAKSGENFLRITFTCYALIAFIPFIPYI